MDAPTALVRQAVVAKGATRRGDEVAVVAALRRYDGALARLTEAVGIERPALVDRSPAGRNRRRREIERLLAEAGVVDLRG